MRYLTCGILIVMSNLTYGQLVSKDFNHVDLFDDFSVEGKTWSTRESEREYFSIQDETYTLRRMASTFFSVSMPQEFKEYGSFEVEVKMKVVQDKDHPAASGGIIFMGQQAGIGAFAFEMNANQQFRFLILRNGAMHPLFPENNEGWVYTRDIKKGKYNVVELRSHVGSFDLFINGEYQQSFMNDTYKSGAIGFYVNASSSIEADYIKVSIPKSDMVASNPEDVDPEDIGDETYAELILMFKNKIDAQQAEINELTRELSICKSSLNIDTTARRQNAELRKENRELQARIQKVEADLTRAQTRLEYLESMKKDIEQSQNGDLVLGLTDLLSKEKKKNKELTQRIAELEKELNSLKN